MCLPCKQRNCGNKRPLPYVLCSPSGVVFHNECELEQEICRQGHVIQVRPTKKCVAKPMRPTRTLNFSPLAATGGDDISSMRSAGSDQQVARKTALADLGRDVQNQFQQQHQQQQQHKSSRNDFRPNKSNGNTFGSGNVINELYPTETSLFI